MNRAGQVLLETLVAAIFLVVLIPNIPALCWMYAGPADLKIYEQVAEQNRAIIFTKAVNIKTAELRAQSDAQAAAELKHKRAALAAESEREHQQAMKLFDDFSDRQANVFANCLTKAGGKLNQVQKDRMIFGIWARANDSCEAAAESLLLG